MAGTLARNQRLLGIDATAYCSPNNYNYSSDYEFPKGISSYMSFLAKKGLMFDVYQFYFGNSLTKSKLADIKLLKLLRKKVFFYFCGCDIRDSKKVIKTYQYSACKKCWPMSCSANRITAIYMAENYANGVFVSTPDLLEFVKDSILLPQPIEIDMFEKFRNLSNTNKQDPNVIRIAHAPSNYQLKGSIYIEEAINALKKEGYPIEFILLRDHTYDEVMTICANSDIIIDQLLIGAYGQYAVEGMALGKPVICYIRDDLEDKYPQKLPLINANIENVKEKLRILIEDAALRESVGSSCLEYVSEVHDARLIAKKAFEYYQKN
jgi:hypothetical protein